MDTSGWNMYVFRDGRRVVSGSALLSSLREALSSATAGNDENLLTALLAAGEFECALADAGPEHTPTAEEITNSIASSLLASSNGDAVPFRVDNLSAKLSQVHAPESVQVSVPEGFAYYALHPLKFARVLDEVTVAQRVVVVGIRSIGVALSAVTLAALRVRGVAAERITVRPTGHPYDRVLELSEAQLKTIRRWSDADFLVVDEGPGLSGSSFLATAEALVRAGIRAEKITMVGTRIPDAGQLRTSNGASRWNQFCSMATAPEPLLPQGADIALGGGVWRQKLPGQQNEVPGSWTQLERLKYVSRDHQRFFRFEGYGHYGTEHARRAELVASAGFGPRFLGNHSGFGCYEFVDGQPLNASDATEELLERIAAYCAFRGREFPVISDQPSDLDNMLCFNWKNEFGAVLDLPLQFAHERLIVTDSRMMPHKWLRTRTGEILKVDSTSHGDDHFFPGPCDIAWDLAGAIVEWNLDSEAEQTLLESYQAFSCQNPRSKIGTYLLAYATFRMAYSRMAARAMGGTQEEPLLIREYHRYRQQALRIYDRLADQNAASQQSVEVGSISPQADTAAQSAG